MDVRNPDFPRSAASGCALAVLFASAIASSARAAIPDSERQALLDLYASTDGDQWTQNDNWNGPPGTECTWFGVVCDDAGAHVTDLSFGVDYGYGLGNNLQGTLPASLSDLTELVSLELALNPLSGPLPSLQRMSHLEIVDIGQDGLSGQFPDLGGLSSLEYFLAEGNLFEGPIPPLTGLDSLEGFDIDNNYVAGPFPDLSGAPALATFSARMNRLTGPMPSLTMLTQLTYFSVSDNLLSGPLPHLAVSNATIDMSSNDFSGAIPPEYMALYSFGGSFNQLSGAIPALQPTAGMIALDGNLLEALPSFEAAANLRGFSASNNQITGSIPSLAGAPLIQSLAVADNRLSGEAPATPNDEMQQMGESRLCPNYLDPTPNAAWDAATGSAPWYTGCPEGTHQSLSQFGIGGTWYNPATGGQGVVLSSMWVQGNFTSSSTLFGGWFTYTPDATQQTDGQRWYSFQGDVDPSTVVATLDLYESVAGRFGGPPGVPAARIGSVTLTFDDCTHGTMGYHFDDQRSTDGSFPIVRLTGSTTCSHNGANVGMNAGSSIYTGAYYDPAASGQGLIIDVSATQNTLFGGWYTYAPGINSDNRRWYSMQADLAPGTSMANSVPIYSSVGGAFGAASPVTTVQVGSANLAFGDCGLTLTLTYRFTAGDNQGYTGTRTLTRLGPPPPCYY